jgi:hypothetical protein
MILNVKIKMNNIGTRVTIPFEDNENITKDLLRDSIAIRYAISTDQLEIIEWSVL